MLNFHESLLTGRRARVPAMHQSLMDDEPTGLVMRVRQFIDEYVKRNIAVTLPLQAPFGSHQWPTLIMPDSAATSLARSSISLGALRATP